MYSQTCWSRRSPSLTKIHVPGASRKTFSVQLSHWVIISLIKLIPTTFRFRINCMVKVIMMFSVFLFIGCFGEYLCSSSLWSYLCSDCGTTSGDTWLHGACSSFWKNSLWPMQACLFFFYLNHYMYLVKFENPNQFFLYEF